jgi:hypothetical protein
MGSGPSPSSEEPDNGPIVPWRSSAQAWVSPDEKEMPIVPSIPYLLLGFLVLPLWVAAGFADYWCHRAAEISENSGTMESVLHLVQFSLVGLPVTLALFIRPNAGFFLLTVVCILLHHLVAYIDVRYADATRKVEPREQMVHSFLEILPITACLLLAVAEWPQLVSLFGLGGEQPLFGLQPRVISLPYTMAAFSAAVLFNLLPYLEELWRCLRSASNKR